MLGVFPTCNCMNLVVDACTRCDQRRQCLLRSSRTPLMVEREDARGVKGWWVRQRDLSAMCSMQEAMYFLLQCDASDGGRDSL